jgi:UDP-3-O-[3-hydroxymyristoyl] glucosamine N-acyltransferase
MLSFLTADEYLEAINGHDNCCAVITTADLAEKVRSDIAVFIAADPRVRFYEVHNWLATNTNFYGVSAATSVSDTAKISPKAHIEDRDVSIGPGCIIEAGAMVLAGSVLEANVTVRAGAIIGTAGFEFKRIDNGMLPVIHKGGVRLREFVEVQSASMIDVSVFGGFTEIGKHTKIDKCVQIAHACVVGERTLIAFGTILGGSAKVGSDTWIGSTCRISDGVRVGDRAHVGIGSIVAADIEDDARVFSRAMGTIRMQTKQT